MNAIILFLNSRQHMTNRQKKVACVGLILFTIWNSTDKTNLCHFSGFRRKHVLIITYIEKYWAGPLKSWHSQPPALLLHSALKG